MIAGRIDADVHIRAPVFAKAPRLQKIGGELRRIHRAPQARPQLRDRAHVILMGVGDDEREKILPHALDEGEIGHDQVDAGKVRACESEAAINEDPLAAARRTEPVERRVHADLAEPAERHEDQFILIARHVMSCGWRPRRRSP